jgi:hypothetical protein
MLPRCSSFLQLWPPGRWFFYLPPNARCWWAEGSPQRSAGSRLSQQQLFRLVWTRCSSRILNATMVQEYRWKLLQRLIHTTLERKREGTSSDWNRSACLWLTGTRTYRLALRSQQAGSGRMRRTSRPRVLLSQKCCRKCLHNTMVEAKPDILNRVQFRNRGFDPVIRRTVRQTQFCDPWRVEPWFSNWTRLRTLRGCL